MAMKDKRMMKPKFKQNLMQWINQLEEKDMHKQPKRTKLTTAIFSAMALIGAGVATAGPLNVTNTFQANTPATAASVNQNFTDVKTAVDDNDGRITGNAAAIGSNRTDIDINTAAVSDHGGRIVDLESGGGSVVNVNCSSNPLALKNTAFTKNSTYVLTGMCDGQIIVGAGLGAITIEGDGGLDDGIALPAGETDANTVVAAIYGTNGIRLNLKNLVISAENYNSVNDLYIAGVGSYRAAHVVLENVNVLGGDEGVSAAYTGSVTINGGVSVTGFRSAGLIANGAAVIRGFDSIAVTGGANQDGSVSEALVAVNGGVVRLTGNANDITPASGASISVANDTAAAVSAFRNGTITVDGGTINGTVWSGESSAVDLRNLTQLGGNLNPYRNSVLRIRDSNIAGANGDLIETGDFSTLRLDNTIVNNVSGTGDISTYRYGVIDIRGTSDLNFRDINCADTRELRIGNPPPPAFNVGVISCQP
jgi:hypothetical protein